jgi:hypothetical protein
MSRWASLPSLKVRFQGMTPASKGGKKLRRLLASGAGAFGAPSAWLFLIRLHACRAGLRFTRHHKVSSPFAVVNHGSLTLARRPDRQTLLYSRSRRHE